MLSHGTNWIAEPIVTSVLSLSDYQINGSLSTDVPVVEIEWVSTTQGTPGSYLWLVLTHG